MGREQVTRLRWRLRGAWQWPAFCVLSVAEAVVLNRLPVWGDGPGGFVPGLLLAACLNLVVVAVLAPLAGRLVRRRRPDLPRAIATDYAGTAGLAALLVALIAGGLAHRGVIREEQRSHDAQAYAVAGYVRSQAPQLRPGLKRMDTLRLEPEMFRSCVPGDVPGHRLCLIVHTDQTPPGITVDPNPAPNEIYRARSAF
jgi:hypothetical protein